MAGGGQQFIPGAVTIGLLLAMGAFAWWRISRHSKRDVGKRRNGPTCHCYGCQQSRRARREPCSDYDGP